MDKFGAIFVAVLATCVVGALSKDFPTLHSCEITAASMEGDSFVQRALGGDAKCVDAEDKEACCEQIRGLFSSGGAAEFCMCDNTFFSTIMMALPSKHNVDPTKYADLLEECDIPVAGKLPCPGGDENGKVEPPVQSQIIGAALLLKALSSRKAAPVPSPSPTPPKPTGKVPHKHGHSHGHGLVVGKKATPTYLLVQEQAGTPTVTIPNQPTTIAPKQTAGAIQTTAAVQPAVAAQPAVTFQPTAPVQPAVQAPVVTTAPVTSGGSFAGGSFAG